MIVSCPECGKQIELPDSKLSQLVKCRCKFSFRTKPPASNEESSTEKKNASPKAPIFIHQTESESDSLLYDEETVDQSSELLDETVEAYITDLRKRHIAAVTQEQTRPDKTPDIEFDTRPIELAERPSERKATSEENSDFFDQNEPGASPNTPIEDSAPPLQASGSPRQRAGAPSPMRKEAAAESQLDAAIDQLRSHPLRWSLGFVGSIGLITLVFFGLRQDRVEEPEVDLFLEEMLRPRSESSRTNPPNTQARPSNSNRTGQKGSSPASRRASQSKPSSGPKIQRLIESGQFEQGRSYIRQMSQLPLNDRALVYEAHFLSTTLSNSEKMAVFRQLREDMEANPNASLLRRSEAVALLKLNHQAEAIRLLESLLVTRASDDLVYAYTGLAYFHTGKIQLALKAWNQALTLNSRLDWVRDEREKAIQHMISQD
ncbi:MAG: hypothetical protein EA369_09350 [Bradymonadales bacterium]|nr:MAG: hypothetical protein EA369_09350 [Bradymonadales bacterium]